MTITIGIVIAWLAVGAVVGLIEARHGAWRKAWVVDAILGPFAVPLAWQRRRVPQPEPVVLSSGQELQGAVDVLIGIDGSPNSMAAAQAAVALFGAQVHRVTLATVLDIDTAAPHTASALDPQSWPEEHTARAELSTAAAALQASSGHEPGAVVLAGEPADALARHAAAGGYDVVVIGRRGRGLSKLVLGSCASKLASKTAVPVLLIPARNGTATGSARAAADRPPRPA